MEQDRVFAIVGTLGSPTNLAVQKYLAMQHVPQLFSISGATRLLDPVHFPWSVPLQVMQGIEGRWWAKFLATAKPDAKIAVLYQNDAVGRDYLEGLKQGLGDKADHVIVATASFENTDPTVESQVISLHSSGANTLIEFTAVPKLAAQTIRKVHDLDWHPLHILGSTASAATFTMKPKELAAASGLVSLNIYKDPRAPNWQSDPDILKWRDFMTKNDPSGDQSNNLSLLGYSVARLYAEVLRDCGNDLTRAHLVEVVTHLRGVTMPILVPGVTINYTPTNYTAYTKFQPVRFTGERWETFGDLFSAD